MSWVKEALEGLSKGAEVAVRPAGGSMRGRIESGQLVTLKPVLYSDVEAEDVIFIRWKNNYLLHLLIEKKISSSSSAITSENKWLDSCRCPYRQSNCCSTLK